MLLVHCGRRRKVTEGTICCNAKGWLCSAGQSKGATDGLCLMGRGPPWSKGLIKWGSTPHCYVGEEHSRQRAQPRKRPGGGQALNKEYTRRPDGWSTGQQAGSVLLTGVGGDQGRVLTDQGPDRDSGFDSECDEKPLEDLCRAVSAIVCPICSEGPSFPLFRSVSLDLALVRGPGVSMRVWPVMFSRWSLLLSTSKYFKGPIVKTTLTCTL